MPTCSLRETLAGKDPECARHVLELPLALLVGVCYLGDAGEDVPSCSDGEVLGWIAGVVLLFIALFLCLSMRNRRCFDGSRCRRHFLWMSYDMGRFEDKIERSGYY